MTKPVVIDMFSGAGGLSLGFEQAGLRVALAIDIDSWSVSTYRRNFPNTTVISADLSTISAEQLLEVRELEVGDVDVVIPNRRFLAPICRES